MTVMHISAEHDTRCNMNVKKLIGTSMIALLVVALCAGMAAAQNVIVTAPGSTDLLPGDTTGIAYAVEVNGIDLTAGSHTIIASIQGPGNPNDLEFEFVWGTSDDSEWVSAGTSCTWTPGASTENFVINVRAKSILISPIPTDYNFAVGDSDGGYGFGIATTKASTSDIPEFATLAIPVVALLGLVLFMRRKKD